MKILILNSEYPPIGGGAGNASACLAAEFVDLNHEVKLLTTRYAAFPKEEFIETRGKNHYHLIRLPALRRNEEKSNALEQVIFMITATLFGAPIVKNWKPEVVIAFFGVPCGVSALLWHWIFGVPYVVSLRGGDVPGFRPYDFALYHRLISPLLRMVWHHASHVIANSEGLRQLALAFDNQVEIKVIPNGVDTEKFFPKEKEINEQPTTTKLLFVGRLVYQKGLDLLIDALKELKEYDWYLTIVGDGPLRDSLQEIVKQNGLNERVEFTGWVHREKLPSYYQQAHLFVLPSRHEGMSNVVLEAMASGLPVIGTDIAGNQELIIDGETGWLIAPNDLEALKSSLRLVLDNKKILQDMGRKAYHYILKNFSWRKMAEDFLTLLVKLNE